MTNKPHKYFTDMLLLLYLFYYGFIKYDRNTATMTELKNISYL